MVNKEIQELMDMSKKMQDKLGSLTKLGYSQIENIEDESIKVFLKQSMSQAVKGKMDVNAFMKQVENLNIKK